MTFNQSLAQLYQTKQINLQTAIQRSSLPDELQDMINRGVGTNAAPGGPPRPGMPPRPPAAR